MFKKLENDVRRLISIRADSSSDDEFEIRLAVAGGAKPLPKTMYRLYRIRQRHAEICSRLAITLIIGGTAAFAFTGGLLSKFGTEPALYTILTSLLVMPALTLLILAFEDFCMRLQAFESLLGTMRL